MSRTGGTADALVVGAGIVGACCADTLTAAGMSVVVVEQRSLAGGTTAAGEGNILVSDKAPGPELELALDSRRLWAELGETLDDDFELDAKGGVVVATTDDGLAALRRFAAGQRAAGVDARCLDPVQATGLEPHLTPTLAGGVHYPQDMQVQPVLASAAILRRARQRGARVRTGTAVIGIDVAGGRVRRVHTSAGPVDVGVVVNAAGVWSPELAALAGSALPVRPRRGHILVTEALPPLIRHKVYDGDYVGTVTDAGAGDEPQVSSVVEGTASGTILIGSSRELVGFDRRLNTGLMAAIARRAAELFPVLGRAQVIRAYVGFRPFTPDHLPIIGEDPQVGGLVHATGHEGAGIGLAPATGALVAAAVTGSPPVLDPQPFLPSPERFPEAVHDPA